MDFVHDQLVNGQTFRVLTVVDNWSRESPVLEVGFRLTGNSVVEALSRVGKTVRLPACITMDHGTEFTRNSWAQLIFSARSTWPLQLQVNNLRTHIGLLGDSVVRLVKADGHFDYELHLDVTAEEIPF